MFDSFALIDALAAVIKGEAADSVLDEYARLRRKVFLEVTSPISCESKRRVFHLTDAELLKERQRLIAARDTGIGVGDGTGLYSTFALETKSLITGRSTAKERYRTYGKGPTVWHDDQILT